MDGTPSSPGGKGWITARAPMDVPTRARILLGTLAVVVALASSMALVNLLIAEPGTGDGDSGGNQGGFIEPNPGQGFQPDPNEGGGEEGEGEGEEEGGKNNPCKTGRSIVRSSSIVTATMSMLLWILAVWWRQHRQTRVMNGWAIAAMVFTLMAVTMFFAWYIVEKICSLRVTDFDTCKELARNLMATFIAFLVPAIGFIAFAIYRKKQGERFLSLWAGAGFVFLYLSIMAMGGWLIASDICDQYFEPPDIDDFDPDAPDGEPGDSGNPDNPDPGGNPSDPPPSGGQNSNPNTPGGNQNANPGGNSAPRLVGVPQISPVALLVLMGIAAIVVIIVLALRGGGKVGFSGGAAVEDVMVVEDRGSLLALLGRKDLKSDDKVIAAYRAFLAWCTVRGVGKLHHETPMEHAHRAASRLDLPLAGAMDLAVAYSHTRLGNTAAPDALRQKALTFTKDMGRQP